MVLAMIMAGVTQPTIMDTRCCSVMETAMPLRQSLPKPVAKGSAAITGRMEKYQNDTLDYELFPEGIKVYAYKEDGFLESTIFANSARHDKSKGRPEAEEIWMATDNVVVSNMENGQTMETDWYMSKQ